MEKILIQTNSKQYPLYLGSGIIANILEIVKATHLPISKILIISDEVVSSLYLQRLIEPLLSDFQVYTKVVESGEQAKSFKNYYECQTTALTNGLDRDSLIIALGGGVVGDLAGFVAATFMRGISFIQVPTTLLAHDSAVGGKVAINHPLGKNMIGSFFQPEAVVYDIELLSTLPKKEIRSGFAEIIKHALISDLSFYHWCRTKINNLADIQSDELLYAIKSGIKVKADIISKDERELGIRAFLNFGHTLGHAIEAEMGYGNLSHGDAVAIGMLFAIKVSERYFEKSLNYLDIKKWFTALDFPTSIPSELNIDKILNRMKHDKKAKNGTIKMVLIKDIGEVVVVDLDDEYIRTLIKSF